MTEVRLLTEQCLQVKLHLSVRITVPRIGSRVRNRMVRTPNVARYRKDDGFIAFGKSLFCWPLNSKKTDTQNNDRYYITAMADCKFWRAKRFLEFPPATDRTLCGTPSALLGNSGNKKADRKPDRLKIRMVDHFEAFLKSSLHLKTTNFSNPSRWAIFIISKNSLRDHLKIRTSRLIPCI